MSAFNSDHRPKAQIKRNSARSHGIVGLPYPNYGLGRTELPDICHCYYDGHQFFVTREDMYILYQNGAFGTSSKTFRGPVRASDFPYDERYYYKKGVAAGRIPNSQLGKVEELENNGAFSDPSPMDIVVEPEPTKLAAEPMAPINSNAQEESLENTITADGIRDEVFLKGDTVDGIQKSKTDLKNKRPEEERLILLPEEVIFLSFGVGCLSIQQLTTGESLSFEQIWNKLITERPEFPYFYAVYHYFRSKNWVPKDGIKYGGDYILYEVGPEYYHATYILHITGLPSRREPNWTELYSWQRVAKQSSKIVLLCRVEVPDEFQTKSSTPRSIFALNLSETTIHRWTHSSDGIDLED